MPRSRVAIAHFDDLATAEAMRATLTARGAGAIRLIDVAGSQYGSLQLEVELLAANERGLLEVLLASPATRVEVHDHE